MSIRESELVSIMDEPIPIVKTSAWSQIFRVRALPQVGQIKRDNGQGATRTVQNTQLLTGQTRFVDP